MGTSGTSFRLAAVAACVTLLSGCFANPFGLFKNGGAGSSLSSQASSVDPAGVYAVSPYTIKVAWSPVGAYTSFVVFSSNTAGDVRLGSDFSSGWVTSLSPNLSYDFHVYGQDAQGNQSQSFIKEYRFRTWKGFDQAALAVVAQDSARFTLSFDYSPWTAFPPGVGVMAHTRVRCYLRSNASIDDDPFDPAGSPAIIEGPLGTGSIAVDGYALGLGGNVRAGCEAVYADQSVIRNPHLVMFTPHFHLAQCPSTQGKQDQVFSCPMAFVDDAGNVIANAPGSFELDPSQNTCGFLKSVDLSTGQPAASGKLLQGTPNNNQVGNCLLAYRPHGAASANTPSMTQQLTIANAAPVWTRVGIANFLVKNVYPSTDAGYTQVLGDADVQTNEETQGAAVGELFGTYSETRTGVTGPCSDYGSIQIDTVSGRTLFKPDVNYFGTCNIGIQFNDGNVGSGNNIVTTVVAVHVLERNSPPEITDGPGTGTPRVEHCGDHCYVGAEYDFTINANPGGGQYVERDQHISPVVCSSSAPSLLEVSYCQVDPRSHQFEITLVPLAPPAAGQAMPTVTIQLTDDGYDEFANSRDANGNWVITRQAHPLQSTAFTFQVDTQNFVQKFHPAVVVNRPECLMCHAQITGDVFTDLGRESLLGPQAYFPKGAGWTETISNAAISWGTIDYITGNVYVQNAVLPDHGPVTSPTPIPAPATGLAPYPSSPAPTFEDSYYWFWVNSTTTIQQLMSTPGMLWIKPGQYTTVQGGYSAAYPIYTANTYLPYPYNTHVVDTVNNGGAVQPIQDIVIRFPLLSDIQAIDTHGVIDWSSPTAQVAFAGRLPTDPVLAAQTFSGLSVVQTSASAPSVPSAVPYVTNTGPVTCLGDVLVSGILVLNGAVIQSADTRPCRIHVAGPVYIYGKDGNPDGITVQAAPGLNIGTVQIASTMGIFMGEGPDMLDYWEIKMFMASGDNLALIKPPLSATQPAPTFGAMARSVGISPAMDGCHGQPSGGCGNDPAQRTFNFHRVLLDAPYILARYHGLFQGAVIADFAAFRLGSLTYAYDPALDTQVAFPRFRAIRNAARPQGLAVFDVKTQ